MSGNEPSAKGSLSKRDWSDYVRSVARHGLTDDQVAALAVEFANSGVKLDFGEASTADVASTGGPSSLSTLLTPLFLVREGFQVPKLGVPGRPAGGLDVLAQIPGYKIDLDPTEIRVVIAKCGYAHFNSAGLFAPLDAEIFRLRQGLAVQAVPELVIASLLSKKIAVGVRSVGLDVRIAPHGNFGDDYETGRRNAKRFISVAKLLGLRAVCILTDAQLPFQPFVGRGESLWAMSDALRGDSDDWLQRHVAQCEAMAYAVSGSDVRQINSPPSVEFAANVDAHGGSYDGFLDKVEAVRRSHIHFIESPDNGFIRYDLEIIRSVLVSEQKKTSYGGPFPDPAGVRLLVEPGNRVTRAEPVMSIRLGRGTALEVMDRLRRALIVSHTAGSAMEDEVVK
ncbi:hypothetical protein [Mesorhizobium sp. M0676]|uniref:hypothetical protein n=1 Tax=Mesorhizobium sp. M0676 TaxID=2956984 RepID=UPI003338A78F